MYAIRSYYELAIEASIGQQQYSLSWQELMLGTDLTPDDRLRFILTKPQLDYSKPFPAETAMKEVRRLANNLHLTEENGVRVRLRITSYNVCYTKLLRAISKMALWAERRFAEVGADT